VVLEVDSGSAPPHHPAMDRRCFLVTSLVGVLAAPRPGRAQQAGKIRRIGYLDQGSAARNRAYVEAFRSGLRDLGWREGRNVALELRFADGQTEQLPQLATELVRSGVDLIVTWSTPAALAAKGATTTIPIVIGFAADPVGSGIVSSLAQPGGNISGWTHQGFDLRAKYLELLKQAVPGAHRFGVLWNPSNQVHKPSLKVIETAAEKLQVELDLVGVRDAEELESALSAMVGRRVEGLVVFPDGMFVAQKAAILAFVARSRLPTMYGVREYAEAGGLMAYGANLLEMQRLGASYVDKILRGANPAGLPIAQPTRVELIVNLKTAKALGLTIPPRVLLRADELIE